MSMNIEMCIDTKEINEEKQKSSYAHSNILSVYILANVSIALTRNEEMKKDINRLYELDSLRYYDSALNSMGISHVVVTQGSLEQEVCARKALGILVTAEEDYELRSKIIKLLRKYYPKVYKSVKQMRSKELAVRYLQMNEAIRRTEKRLESAVYLYLVKYCSVKKIDQSYVYSILDDIHKFELISPMTANIDQEIQKHEKEIKKIKMLIEKQYGKVQDYNDILNSENEAIYNLGGILGNLFIINKIDINEIFYNSNLPNIDNIILAYIKRGYKDVELELVIQSIISGIIIQYFMDAYRKSKKIYFENNQETLYFQLCILKEELKKSENENEELKLKVDEVEKLKVTFDKEHRNEINKLSKEHKAEIVNRDKIIKELEKRLLDEEKYRNELNILREHTFQIKNEYIPKKSTESLDYYLSGKRILVVGGVKEWRRRFKEKYPQIQTLNGFNDNFDASFLNNIEYVFFYTGFMSHSTYIRMMNYIRPRQLKFGYIGKTNMELVEEELIEELQKFSVGRKMNL